MLERCQYLMISVTCANDIRYSINIICIMSACRLVIKTDVKSTMVVCNVNEK